MSATDKGTLYRKAVKPFEDGPLNGPCESDCLACQVDRSKAANRTTTERK